MAESETPLFHLTPHGPVLQATIAAQHLTALDVADEFCDALHDLIESRREAYWLLDFQAVTFMVTPAVNALVNAAKQVRSRGGELAVTGLNKNIAQVFSLMRLDEVFGIHADVEAGVKALRSRAK
jgi:anti-sigma B factor antagonist